MKRTILSVLDCMIEAEPCNDDIQVYYNILECDEDGRTPEQSQFNPDSKSAYQIIAKQGNKSIVYHNAVRLLTRRKWKDFAQRRFQFNSILNMISLFCLTFSAVVGVMSPNPTSYQSKLQRARAVMEVFSVIMVFMTVLTEINQCIRRGLEYFTDTFNWFEFTSSILLLCVFPLRFTEYNAQWHVFAFGFLSWTIRIFKYATVFRQTGAYAQILSRILAYDFVQFGIVFLIILLAFSVSFYLSLRGDMDLHVHNETSTFWGIFFVSIRSLTEAAPVVEYTGEDGYGVVIMILMVLFLFTCIVIMLNILIAQMTDTYQKVQQDAQRGLEVNRAWIVARAELNNMLCGSQSCPRKHFYVESEEIMDLKNVLIKWESPPLNEMNKTIRDIWDSLENHKLNLLTVQQRLARQDDTLQDIHSQFRPRRPGRQ